MSSPLRRKENNRHSYRFAAWSIALAFASLLCIPEGARAQDSLAMTVTPPLFQVAVEPGESWRSSIRVVNNNPYDIDVYATAVGFEPVGEEGTGKFVPIVEQQGTSSATLAGWIELSNEPIRIPREQTAEVAFRVAVPEDASPGGHYAAIMVTNRPPEAGEGNQVSVASSIASLVFMRVAGDVVESGRIRDFYAEKYLYQSPESQFSIRFENQGNVHLLPQGGITIYNMWGKERGHIPINTDQANFGNVLPNTVRKFTFTWKGDMGLYDIGRYKAVATLAFGAENRQNVTAMAYFWVIPVWTTLKVLGALALFLAFFFWAIRAYIRRALALEAGNLQSPHATETPQTAPSNRRVLPSRRPHQESLPPLRTLVRPIEAGAVDLRRLAASKPVETKRVHKAARSSSRIADAGTSTLTMGQFLRKYWLFFVFLAVVSICLMSLSTFFGDVLTKERDFEVTIEQSDEKDILLDAEVSGSE
jgi:hypothetical protein